MIIKMLCTFDFNPETNTYTPIGNPEIVKEKSTDDGSTEPKLTLEDNKYHLNSAAIKLLNAEIGDRIDIRYQLIEKISYPIIGLSSVWNGNSGNKLTKSNTVSYRGTANSVLARFGTIFTMVPWKDHDGLFVLVGSNTEAYTSDDNIELPVNDELDIDIELDDDLDLTDETTELKGFKFKF